MAVSCCFVGQSLYLFEAGALGSPDTSNVGLEFEVVDPGPGFSSNARSQCFSSGPGFFWSLLSQVGTISPQAV